MQTRRLATEPGMLNAPTDFLFIPLVVRETDQLDPPLNTHLVGFSRFLTFIVANLCRMSISLSLISTAG